ncbi:MULTISPECIES: hypothetical protein [unclassified Thermococcus]|uniref:hypothetical protein n=1 Tax=unclassified Thermococcus TaxID=2627626 RepID=UPI001F0FEFC8|nr:MULTISPECIES: hypothetical protein [unclassified Thermococcus]
MKDKEKVQKVRNASKTLNRVGYFVYRNFVGEWFVQEQFGGLILESFLAMKPYLEALRIQSECAEKGDEECVKQPWFMRRFYLLIVVISYKYMAEEFEQQCRELFKKYGYDFALPVPESWLARDVKNWLKKRGYL